MTSIDTMSIDELCINTIRTLSIDAVQAANSGHPGTPMALAPLAYVLWSRLLRFNPQNPHWFNRDRFVLSNGHASMLLYAMLYLSGYDLTLEDIKQFRQWGSRTPGHPEHGITPGVETTTGPLAQGVMSAVGMAMAEAHLAAVYNQPDCHLIDHHTYVLCGDGDVMEGASLEAASLAGHLRLGKLICIYDDNRITIEGQTSLSYSDDIAQRFVGHQWHVQNIGDRANDLQAIEDALLDAKRETQRPSLIIMQSHIGYGSPTYQDTSTAHGSPLGAAEVKATKRAYGWPEDAVFLVPQPAQAHMRQAGARGAEQAANWQATQATYRRTYPDLARQFEAACQATLPGHWDADIPHFEVSDGPMATRAASGKSLNAFAARIPWLIGGSADLAPSTNTLMRDSGYLQHGHYENRNIAWGIREHAMCGCSAGMMLHGGLQVYVSTFFVFTDYARPAIRLAALMRLPVIYVMTHDSVGLGEDGPTHQPIEHLASLRAMPNVCVIRPADANETAYAWRVALQRRAGPTMLVLSRQSLPIFDRQQNASAAGLLQGAYILSPEDGRSPDVVLLASGSEVQLMTAAQSRLKLEGIDARVVSMPSWELFEEQSQAYRDHILPARVKARLAVEAGSPLGWRQWVGEAGDVIAMSSFGASAPAAMLFKQYGFTVDHVVKKAKILAAAPARTPEETS